MKVVVLEDEHLVLLQGEPRSTPDSGQLLIRVRACVAWVPPQKSRRMFGSNEYGRHHLGREVSGDIEAVGSDVQGFQVGNEVVVLLPLDSSTGGLAEYVCVPQYWVVKKSPSISHTSCAAALRGGLLGYTALHYHHRTSSGDLILITKGNFAGRSAIVQLARFWGGRVLLPAYTSSELSSLLQIAEESEILDLTTRATSLASVCLEATGGTGVDCIIDAGETSQLDASGPAKHDLLTCLAPNGSWITMTPDLQLDPPDSQLLFWKGARVSFLNEFVWGLSGTQQGRLLHIMADIVEKVQSKVINVQDVRTTTLDSLTLEDTRDTESTVTVVTPR